MIDAAAALDMPDFGEALNALIDRVPGPGRGGRHSDITLAARCTALGHPVDRTHVYRVREGEKEPKLRLVGAFARALDVDVRVFFDREFLSRFIQQLDEQAAQQQRF